jgi:hypothetical protein
MLALALTANEVWLLSGLIFSHHAMPTLRPRRIRCGTSATSSFTCDVVSRSCVSGEVEQWVYMYSVADSLQVRCISALLAAQSNFVSFLLFAQR